MMEGYRLRTAFQLNVKGETPFGGALIVSGTVSAEAGATASE